MYLRRSSLLDFSRSLVFPGVETPGYSRVSLRDQIDLEVRMDASVHSFHVGLGTLALESHSHKNWRHCWLYRWNCAGMFLSRFRFRASIEEGLGKHPRRRNRFFERCNGSRLLGVSKKQVLTPGTFPLLKICTAGERF